MIALNFFKVGSIKFTYVPVIPASKLSRKLLPKEILFVHKGGKYITKEEIFKLSWDDEPNEPKRTFQRRGDLLDFQY